MYRTFLFSYFFLSLAFFSRAQQPYGLLLNNVPAENIYGMHSDAKGYIWLASDIGLLKYDGFTFTSFKSSIQTSLSGSDIKEDKYSRIWYQNFDGYIYYIQDEKINYIPQNTPAGFISYGLTDHYLFIVQKKGVDVFGLKDLKFIKTIAIPPGIAEQATSLKNNFYLITDNILYRIDDSLRLTSTTYFENKKLHVKYIYPYKDQLYVVSKLNEEKKIYFFAPNLKFQKSIDIPDLTYIQASDVIDGLIWLHSPRGSFAYNDSGRRIFKKPLFSENSISKIIKDYNNNYWFSTVNDGVYIVPELNNQAYNVEEYNPQTFLATKTNYLIGSQNGVLFSTSHLVDNRKTLFTTHENLPIYYIYQDTIDKNIIFSGKGFNAVPKGDFSKLKNYDIALKEIVRLDDKYYAFSASGFCALFLNPLADTAQPSRWDALFRANQDRKIPQMAIIIKGVRAKSATYNSRNETLYLSTNIGLFKVTPSDIQEIKRNNTETVFTNKTICLNDKVFTLTTKGTLLQITDDQNFISINKKYGIEEDDIKMIRQSAGKLLLLTSDYIGVLEGNKLRKIDIWVKANAVRNLTIQNNKVVMLTKKDILPLHLMINASENKTRFYIDYLKVNNEKRKISKMHKLSHRENTISIGFSVLEYLSNNTPVYYRINKERWVLINKETRTLQFPLLSAGNYTIEFKVRNHVTSEKIMFEILQPFWKKWWFYLLSLIAGGILIYLYFRKKSIIMKRQIALLNEKVALEKSLGKSVLSSIKSQMNPHFFYNALNTIQAYIFTNDKQKANNYLAKFSKLTRIILEMSEKETVFLSEDIQAIKLYLDLEKMRFSDDFTYEILTINIEDKENIEFPPMLLQPYIENSVKHGLLHRQGLKKLIISFEQKEQFLYVTIDDNGIGRKRAGELNFIKKKNHQSFSTRANEKRLEILNQDRENKITFEIIDKINSKGEAEGTTVILVIPVD